MEIAFVVGDVAGDVFAEHLRLFAFVEDFQQQPQVVPLGARVFGEREEMAAGQRRFITFAFGEFVVAAMALQGTGREELAALAGGESPRAIWHAEFLHVHSRNLR